MRQSQKGFKIVGVNISPNMIEIAKKQVPSGEFFVSDMTECEFNDEEFDLIVSAFAIIHFPQEKQVDLFKNIFRWLKPGGATYFTLGDEDKREVIEEDWHGAKMFWSYFSPEKYREMFGEIGFKLAWDEIENLPNGETFYNVILKK